VLSTVEVQVLSRPPRKYVTHLSNVFLIGEMDLNHKGSNASGIASRRNSWPLVDIELATIRSPLSPTKRIDYLCFLCMIYTVLARAISSAG
jgi:hypothetical protein